MNHNKYIPKAAEISHFNIANSSLWPYFNRLNLKRNLAKRKLWELIPVKERETSELSLSLWEKKGTNKETEHSVKMLEFLSKKHRFANCWFVELILDRQPGIAWNTPGLLGTTST